MGRRGKVPEHRRLTREAKDYATLKARDLPVLWPVVAITVHHFISDRNPTHWPDVGNIYPTVKAYIDGVVAAGKLPNDRPATVAELRFVAPVVQSRDRIVLEIAPC